MEVFLCFGIQIEVPFGGSIQTALAATELQLSFAPSVLLPKPASLQPFWKEHSSSMVSSTLDGMITVPRKVTFSQSHQYHFLSVNPLQLLFSPTMLLEGYIFFRQLLL